MIKSGYYIYLNIEKKNYFKNILKLIDKIIDDIFIFFY